MAASIPPINKHFIQSPHHWIMSKIFRLFLSTWRILGFLKWVTRSICFWYRPMLPTNKGLHLGFPADEEGCLAKRFSDMNQQVIGHQYCYLLTSFTFAFRKQNTIPFSTLHCKPTIWKARFYFSQFSFSHNVEENFSYYCYSHHQLQDRCLEMRNQKWNNDNNNKKTLKNKFCINNECILIVTAKR